MTRKILGGSTARVKEIASAQLRSTGPYRQDGFVAEPVYLFTENRRRTTIDSIPVLFVDESDLRENGGRYSLAGGPARPVYIDANADGKGYGLYARPVYVVGTLPDAPQPGGGGGSAASPLLDSLESYWSLDEASGTRVDSHGSNTLTDNNTVGSAAGKQGNAAQFVRANNEYLSRADNVSLSAGDVDFTLAAWCYFEAKPASGGLAVVNKFSDSVTANREYSLDYLRSSDRFRLIVRGGANQTAILADSLGVPAIQTWYFVVAWHDAAANTINIQVNDGTVDSTAHTTGVNDGTETFYIGRHAGRIDFDFDGLIDEVGFWKRKLTAAEKTFLWNSSNGRTYAEIQAYGG